MRFFGARQQPYQNQENNRLSGLGALLQYCERALETMHNFQRATQGLTARSSKVSTSQVTDSNG